MSHGGVHASAPSTKYRDALHERHAYAMEIVKQLSVDERWELLAAVVWPQSDELLDREQAA